MNRRRQFTAARRSCAFLAGCVVLSSSAGARAEAPLVVDHSCTELGPVPAYWIEQAKAQFRLSYGHTSHGSQIVSGMNVIKDPPGSLYWWDHDGTLGGLSMWDYTPPGDLGNPDRYTWEVRTRQMLDEPGCDRNCVMWSWCGQADTTPENMQIYLDLMSGLIADYPDVTFIYMTGHLNGTGEEGNLHQRNNQIRDHVIATNGVLFDFADIESYDPDGSYFLDLFADDGCWYWLAGAHRNWAIEWCDANPGACSTCSCAHSQSLNCDMKGRAFWWMMARLAGWNGPECPADVNGDGTVDVVDLLALLPAWGPCGGPCPEDINGDGIVNVLDLLELLAAWGPCP
jgi:hypothetical protein